VVGGLRSRPGRIFPRIVCGLLLATASSAAAQDVSVRAYLASNPVSPNRPFDLHVEVVGTQRLDADPVPPDLDFATFVSSGRTTSVQIVNGQTSVSLILVYRYQPTRIGTFEIGPMSVQAGGETLPTNAVSVTVGQANTPSRPGQPAQRPPPRPEPDDSAVASDDLFLTTEVRDTRVFVGEPVIVEYRIWTRVNVSQYTLTTLPANTGFWVEEFPLPSPEVEQVDRDGVPFATAVIRKVALFPTGPGTRTVDGLGVEAQIRVQRRSRDVLDDFFNRSLLGGLESIEIESEPVEIEVLPLPPGQPRDFSGFVGSLDVNATVDRRSVETNDAISLVVRVTAEGNVQTLPAPELAFPSEFEVYPPEVSEQIDRSGSRVRGAKIYQYVLIPRAPGTHTIPGISMGFFDPSSGEFATATTDPISLDVTGDAIEGPLPGLARGSIEPLREDIRFISIAVPSFRPAGRKVFGQAGFWIVLFLPVAVVGGAAGIRRHQDRLAGDVAYARGRRASRTARKRLTEARRLVHGDARKFYAEVGRALQGFLGNRLNVAEAGMMTEDVRARLAGRGVSDETARAFLACLDECDRLRFSPSEAGAGDREAFLGKAEGAMSRLDQEARR